MDLPDQLQRSSTMEAQRPAKIEPPTQEVVPIVVVGAHLSGMPLNKDLVERGAVLNTYTKTAAHYRLFALDPKGGTRKPGLKRVASFDEQGAEIEVEVWDLPASQLWSFMSTIPHPLGIGSVELTNGDWHPGFVCEPAGFLNASDITGFGGWRAYIAHTM